MLVYSLVINEEVSYQAATLNLDARRTEMGSAAFLATKTKNKLRSENTQRKRDIILCL